MDLQILINQGFNHISFKKWKDGWTCSAWKMGTTEIKSSLYHPTPEEAFSACVTETKTIPQSEEYGKGNEEVKKYKPNLKRRMFGAM